MSRYGGSFPLALQAVFPEHKWRPWMFNQVAKDFWTNPKNKMEFCEEYMKGSLKDRSKSCFFFGGFFFCFFVYVLFAFFLHFLAEHNMTSLEQWYKVKIADIRKFGGGYFVGRLQPLSAVLKSVYPDHEWLEWEFDKPSPGIWTNPVTRKRFLEWFAGVRSVLVWFFVFCFFFVFVFVSNECFFFLYGVCVCVCRNMGLRSQRTGTRFPSQNSSPRAVNTSWYDTVTSSMWFWRSTSRASLTGCRGGFWDCDAFYGETRLFRNVW